MTSVVKCPMGSYGDGIICTQCPFATWTSQIGALDISQCVRSFTYRDPGQLKSYIPFGVTQIVVKIWGGGGGSDNSSDPNFASHSGGGGGFTSCNLTVAHSRNVYVIVGGGGGAYSLTTNAGGFGGGGKGYAIAGYSSGGGGGRSAVQLVLGTDAVTAGGGGGGSDCLKVTGCGGGGGGGVRGLASLDPANGRGGTDIAGGLPGIGVYCNGTAGIKYQGGDGCRAKQNVATAGGGGGYYGGGGGSASGANSTARAKVTYEVDGGGGGGSSYGGGCNLGSYITLAGVTGTSSGVSSSGGKLKRSYETGVGEGGAANSRKPGGAGLVTIQLIPDESFRDLTPGPTSQPTSLPTGQPSGQPTSRPSKVPPSKRPTAQPTSRPTGPFRSNASSSNKIGGLTIQTAIIIFVCVGVVVLCLFIVFTYYCQNKFVNREEDRVHSLVEENYDDDEAVLDDGEGGAIVDSESMYYRQFGETDSPIHLLKDKDGHFVPTTSRSNGGGSLSRLNSMSNVYPNAGQPRGSFAMRKSFGGAGSVTSRDPQLKVHRSSSSDLPLRRVNGSFASVASQRKMLTRNSITSIAGSQLGNDNAGDMTNRSGYTANNRSQSQILSQVRVKSFSGAGPAPRMIKLTTSAGTIDEIARSRYLIEHEDDVLSMQNFFRRAGLSMKKSISAAEEAVCLDANTPRKLFKYVHEVEGFSLLDLGMDEIDEDMVLDALNAEFSHRDLSAESAAAATVAKMMGGTGGRNFTNPSRHHNNNSSSQYGGSDSGGNGYSSGSQLGGLGQFPQGSERGGRGGRFIGRGDHDSDDSDDNDDDRGRRKTVSMIRKLRPEDSAKARYIAEHENDVVDMQEFFRFAGLSIQLSRECAEEAIFMDANSPKKLYKYLADVKGFILTDLGMDPVDADMVYECLKREFGVSTASGSKRRNHHHRHISIDKSDLDYKSDSSEDYDDENTHVKRGGTMNPRQPPGAPSAFMRQSANTVGNGASQPKSQPKTYEDFDSDDHHDAFAAEVTAAMETQQQGGSLTGRSTDSVSTLGMKSEADTYYHIDQTSLHSLGVAVALNKLPPRPSSGVPGHRPARDAVKDKEKMHDLKDFLSQVANATEVSSSPRANGRKDPPKMAVVKEQTYEESMGMDTGADDDDIMEIERLDAVTCYFSHDWSADEMQRSNQELMLIVDEELRARGLTTCVDKSSQPTPFTALKRETMHDNVDKSESILIFVTSKFMGKVNGMDGNNDICKLEYDYALKTVPKKIILVILEERMRDTSEWKGALKKSVTDGAKVVDMIDTGDDEGFGHQMDKLQAAITAVTGKK